MNETNDKMNTRQGKKVLNPFAVKKPKKRSIVERELETNMTSRMTSPVSVGDGLSTSRYGRARRLLTENENGKVFIETLPSKSGNTQMKVQSRINKPLVYKQDTPKKALEISTDNIDNIYCENKALSRFNNESKRKNPRSSSPKVYIRKDLIQNRDDDDNIILIKDLFSPKSGKKQKFTQSSRNPSPNLSKTRHIDNASVVKTLNFDCSKGSKRDTGSDKKTPKKPNASDKSTKRETGSDKKTPNKSKVSDITVTESNKSNPYSNTATVSNKTAANSENNSEKKKPDSNNISNSDNTETELSGTKTNVNTGSELMKVEASSPYQDGELAWARIGTFAFWPCLITRDPATKLFVRKKLFGRVEHYIFHVTFFADNGRRSWVVDNMLRKYTGLEEFISTREKFTIEDKKKDPRLYAAFFISEKKQTLWNCAVKEAEALNREPRNLRIDVFNEMLYESRAFKKQKGGRITRTDSDVSLSESLYDSLFSEDDNKDDSIRSRNRSRNKSLDVSDVVTACLDNMAAKTGNIKIQRQSHMDRWLQIAKSKTPEKVKGITEVKMPVTPKSEVVTPTENVPNPFADKVIPVKTVVMPKERPLHHKKKRLPPKEVKITKVYGLRRSYESQNSFVGEEADDQKAKAKKNFDKIYIRNAKEESGDQRVAKKNADQSDQSNPEANNTTIAITLKEITDCNIIPKNEIKTDENEEPLNKELTINVNDQNRTVLESTNKSLKDDLSTENNNKTSEAKKSSDDTKANVTITQKQNQDIKSEIIDQCQENTNDTPVIKDQDHAIDVNTLTANDSNGNIDKTDINHKKRKLNSDEIKMTIRYTLRKSCETHNSITAEEPENQTNRIKDDESKVIEKIQGNREKAILHVLDSVICSEPSKDEITTNSQNESSSGMDEFQDSTKIDDNNDALLNAIDELLGDNTDNNFKSLKKITENKITELPEDNEVLDVMFVDSQDNRITDKKSIITESQTNESSPATKQINVQKNCGINRNSSKIINDCVEKGMVTNGEIGDFSTEIRKTAEFIGVNVITSSPIHFDSKSNQTDSKEILLDDVSDNASLQTSPTLKRNEMVSIPDNFNLTDDDNTLESVVYSNKTNWQDSHPYIGNELARDVLDTTAKTINNVNKDTTLTNLDNIPFDKLMSLEVPILSNEKLDFENKQNSPIINTEKFDNVSNEQNMSIDDSIQDAEDSMNKKYILNECGHSEPIFERDLLTESGHSKPILERDLLNESGHSESILENDLMNKSGQSESLIQIEFNNEPGTNIDVSKLSEVKLSENNLPENILDNSKVIDKDNSKILDENIFLDQVNMNKPPDLTSHNVGAKAELLQNHNNNDSDYDEDSDDEPSPEYEPLGDEITEDFRQHMMCIESNITDKKDDAQLVKVCNEIAVLVKSKQTDHESQAESSSSKLDVNVQNNMQNGEIHYKFTKMDLLKFTDSSKVRLADCKSLAKSSYKSSLQIGVAQEMVKNDKTHDEIDLSNCIDVTKETVTKEVKDEILEGLEIINKARENNIKSPSNKKRHSLSLKKAMIFENRPKETVKDFNIINERYKTIDQIEEIIKNKPKRLPIENGEVQIPEIKENGYHLPGMDTPDLNDDDFDIEEASVNSEDSEVSLPRNNVPARRSLRSRPVKKGGLEDPEFLTYLELRQDDLMEEHPELSLDDIVLYLYKTYAYGQNLNADVEIEEANFANIKLETPMPSRSKSKKQQVQPKNTIENYFREKYKNAKKIDFDDSICDENVDIKPDEFSISPVDSGIGNSKDSNESDTPAARKIKTNSSRTAFSPGIMKDVKVELINDVSIIKFGSSKTPRKLRQKNLSPRVKSDSSVEKLLETQASKRVPVVIISPIKDKLIDTQKHKSELELNKLKPKTERSTPGVPVVIISPIKDKLTDTQKHKYESEIIERKPKNQTESTSDFMPTKGRTEKQKHMSEAKNITTKSDDVTESLPEFSPIKYERVDKHKSVSEAKIIEHKIESESTFDLGTVSKPKSDKMIEQITTETINIDHITDANPEKDMENKKDDDTEMKKEQNMDTESVYSDSELPLRQLRNKVKKEKINVLKKEISEFKDEIEEAVSVSSDPLILQNEPSLRLRPKKVDKSLEGSYEDPEFLKYQELKQDAIMDTNPQLTQNEITAYLYKTWIYETNIKSDLEKNDDIEASNLVKGVNQESAPLKKNKRKSKVEKTIELNIDADEVIAKDKPKRSKTVSRYYNEEFLSDIEDELEIFEIFKTKKTVVSKLDSPKKEGAVKTESNEEVAQACEEINTLDEIELYFKQLTSPKPSVFKGLVREKVCEICEDINNLIKCKVCNGSFHYECVNKVVEYVQPPASIRGRKKKKKLGRKPKNLDDSENSEDKHDISEDNISMEDIPESITVDADTIEAQIEAKMKELLEADVKLDYDSFSSDDGIDWRETVPGKCELIDVKLKPRSPPVDYSNFKCNNCEMYNTPICFVCKSAISKSANESRHKCNVMHCNRYYHRECLDHWPQTQFNAGAEWIRSRNLPETLTCPRHVCHTCVSDDPRGCKTRFSADKLAKCVRCPATYHSFNKCLPAGTQILTASLIICPRHYEHSPGKVPCHVNTGWCFICALGGSLICCEYCPTSFHAECLNIKPPEGNYMCEDCETGRLPLYGEMVWVKLGHYRWWPGLILHPSEIPENIMAVKHGLGEFVVRFFGQYDHFWVNRGRVFPYQEGDSGRISSQKSKIDAAFTTAMEHAQRAFEILKNAEPNEEESQEINASLLPPQYVKLKSNKPIGSLLGKKIEDPSLSLTQCECNPNDVEPCGAHSQCLNRVLLTECGPTCLAGERCNNRAFEKRQYPKLTAYKAPHRGWGLKTLEDIKAGQFVIEYVGELIDEEEFQWRMRRKHEIRDENFYFLTLDKERMIDAGPKGNLARFMNHCCEPNCETQKWTVLGDVRVGLFAINDIKKNSEVTFNYNLECSGIEKKRCLCGAKRCSGYIGAKPKQLDESERKKNGLAKRKYTKRKNIEETKTKLKRGRPPKPKEQTDKPKALTEIEKDLLIIGASVSDGEKKTDSIPTEEAPISSTKESNEPLDPTKPQAIIDPNATADGTILSSTESAQSKERRKSIKLDSNATDGTIPNNTESREIKSIIKIDSKIRQEATISNGQGPSRVLKRKLHCSSKEQVPISSEPSAKRIKCDKPMEVGD